MLESDRRRTLDSRISQKDAVPLLPSALLYPAKPGAVLYLEKAGTAMLRARDVPCLLTSLGEKFNFEGFVSVSALHPRAAAHRLSNGTEERRRGRAVLRGVLRGGGTLEIPCAKLRNLPESARICPAPPGLARRFPEAYTASRLPAFIEDLWANRDVRLYIYTTRLLHRRQKQEIFKKLCLPECSRRCTIDTGKKR